MDAEELKQRTKAFSLRVVRLAASLPRGRIGDVFARHLVPSGTSVAANYRAACLARSRAEFIAKMGTVREEADETVFWIEMAAEAELVTPERVRDLIAEGNEILAIVCASRRTARTRAKRSPAKPQ